MFAFHWFLIQLKILKNAFKEDKKGFFLRDLWHTFIILCGLVLLYLFFTSMFRFIRLKGMSTFDFAFLFLSFSLVVFLPLLFYSAVVCSLSFLFQKEETFFYFSLPVKRVSVFIVKFLQTYFHTAWMTFLGLIVFLAAMQQSFKVTPWLYLTGSISFLVFLVIPVCAAVILVMIVSRFLPFVQARGMLTVIGLFVGSVLIAAIRVMQPERLVTAEGKMQLVTYIQNLHKPWMTVLPSEWVTNIVFSQVQHDAEGMAVNFLSLCGLAAVLALLAYAVARLFYERIWVDAAVVSERVSKKFTWQSLLAMFPASLRVFIRKDLLSFYRDTVEKGSIAILIPLSFVYIYSVYLLNKQIHAVEEPIFSFLYIYLFNFFYSAVVIAGLSGRWVFPSISLEGNNFRLIKGAAIPLKDFLRAKFLLGLVPLLCVGEVLILGSLLILRVQLPLMLVSMLIMAGLCWGITLICLILGMREADFSIREPLDFALSYKGFLCLVWESLFTALVIALVGVPTTLFLSKGASSSFLLSIAISLIVTLVIFRILYNLYNTSLARLAKSL